MKGTINMAKLNVFISWSQSDSKQIASVLKRELELLFNDEVSFFVSTDDISAGAVGFNVIVDALTKSQIIIVCLDSSNYKRSWLYFETGAIFGRNYDATVHQKPIVFPIIFDELPISSFSGTPFSELQLIKFEKDELLRIVKIINTYHKKELLSLRVLEHHFESTWNNIYTSVNSIIVQRNNGDEQMLSADNVVDKLKDYAEFPDAKHGKTIKYESGFETHTFYKFLLENVKKRLYVFGRKNKKISANDFNQKFNELLKSDIDIKILYLNPDSKEAKNGTAQDIKCFRENLISSIKTMSDRFDKSEYNMESYCKMYDGIRDSELIVADDVIFYKDLMYSKGGKPLHFTNCSFNIVSVDSAIGTDYYQKFNNTWNNAQPISSETAENFK